MEGANRYEVVIGLIDSVVGCTAEFATMLLSVLSCYMLGARIPVVAIKMLFATLPMLIAAHSLYYGLTDHSLLMSKVQQKQEYEEKEEGSHLYYDKPSTTGDYTKIYKPPTTAEKYHSTLLLRVFRIYYYDNSCAVGVIYGCFLALVLDCRSQQLIVFVCIGLLLGTFWVLNSWKLVPFTECVEPKMKLKLCLRWFVNSAALLCLIVSSYFLYVGYLFAYKIRDQEAFVADIIIWTFIILVRGVETFSMFTIIRSLCVLPSVEEKSPWEAIHNYWNNLWKDESHSSPQTELNWPFNLFGLAFAVFFIHNTSCLLSLY